MREMYVKEKLIQCLTENKIKQAVNANKAQLKKKV